MSFFSYDLNLIFEFNLNFILSHTCNKKIIKIFLHSNSHLKYVCHLEEKFIMIYFNIFPITRGLKFRLKIKINLKKINEPKTYLVLKKM